MDLFTVKTSATQIALAINKIVGVDVVIIDDKLRRITDTFRYSRDRIVIRKESIVGRIIESGKALAIDNKEVFRTCIDCPDRANCRMQSLIGVPILHQGRTVGAIALAIPAPRMKDLFENLSHTVGFLEKMAEMLAGKLQAACDYEELHLAKSQRDILIGAIEDAMVLVGEDGRVLYGNQTFSRALLGGTDPTDSRITDLIGHPQIERFFQTRRPCKNRLIYCETRYASFDGYLSITPIEIDGSYRGAVFAFRSILNLDAAISEFGRKRYTLDSVLPPTPRNRGLRERAAAAAGHAEPLLIEGGSGFRKRELAAVIHNTSERSAGNFLLMDCKKSSPVELEEELFGVPEAQSPSKLRLAHKGTLCLCAVDCLPLYLQRQLGDYLVRSAVMISSEETVSDVRLILTTSRNLDELAAKGLFDESLLDRVRSHRIRLPSFAGHPDEAESHFRRFVRFFSDRYHTGELALEPALIDAVRCRAWHGDLPELRGVAEYLVKTARGKTLTQGALLELDLPSGGQARRPTAKELLEEQIRELLDEGRSIEEITDILQISRATLYRKIKQSKIERARERSASYADQNQKSTFQNQ